MLKIQRLKLCFETGAEASTEYQCTWGWYDRSDKASLIATKDAEIEAQQGIVDNLKNVSDSIQGYVGDIEDVSGQYTTMSARFEEVGHFGTDNIDAKGLFSGSQECLNNMIGPLSNLQAQAFEDYEVASEALQTMKDERNDPHFGMVEDCR